MSIESLGELVVSISADLTNLDKGLNDANAKIENAAHKIADATKEIGLKITEMGAAIVGIYSGLTFAASEYVEEINKVSERTGIEVDALSRLRYVAEQTNVNFDELANGLKFLSRNMQEADDGNSKLITAFSKLGISVRDSNGEMKSADTVLKEIADKFQKLPEGPEKVATAMQLMGRAGTALIPVLNLGADGINKLESQTDKFGTTVTGPIAKAFHDFHDNLNDLKEATLGFSLLIAQQVLPKFNEFIVKVTDVVVAIKDWEKEHPVLSSFINNTALALGGLLLVLGPLAIAIGVLINILVGFGAKLIAVSSAIETIIIWFLLWQDTLLTVQVALYGMYTAMIAFLLNPITLIIAAVALLATAWTNNWFNIRQVTENAARDIGSAIDFLYEKVVFVQLFLQDFWEQMKSSGGNAVQSFKNAVNQANQAIAAFKAQNQGKGFTSFADDMANGVKKASDATDKFVLNIKNLFNQSSKIANDGILSILASMALLEKNLPKTQSFLGNFFTQFSKQWKDLAVVGKSAVASTIDTLSLLNSALQGAAQQNKTFAVLARVTALGMAIVNTALGITNALAVPPPWVGLTLASIVGAAGAIQIGTISAQGFAEGTDTVPSMLSPGEMVVPRTFSDAVRAGDLSIGGGNNQSGGEGDINITVNATIMQDMDISKLAKDLAYETQKQLRYVRNIR